MRRFLVVVEVTDAAQSDKDGAALYTIHSGDQAKRFVLNAMRKFIEDSDTEEISITIKLAEELLP